MLIPEQRKGEPFLARIVSLQNPSLTATPSEGDPRPFVFEVVAEPSTTLMFLAGDALDRVSKFVLLKDYIILVVVCLTTRAGSTIHLIATSWIKRR